MSQGAQTVTAMLVALAGVVGIWWLMLLGWRTREQLQREELALPEPLGVDPALEEADPDELARALTDPVPGGVEGVYASTTLAHQHSERVVPHGLGTRSAVRAGIVGGVGGDLLLLRRGARSLRIPAADLVGVRRTRGQAGKYTFGREGMVVITWRLGDVELDTGLRTLRRAEATQLVDAVAALVTAPAGGAHTAGGAAL